MYAVIASVPLEISHQLKEKLRGIPEVDVSLVGNGVIVCDSESFLSCLEIAKFLFADSSQTTAVLFADAEIPSLRMPSVFHQLHSKVKEPGVYAVSSGFKELASLAQKSGFITVTANCVLDGMGKTIQVLPLTEEHQPTRLSLRLAQSNFTCPETSFFGRNGLHIRCLTELREGGHVCLTGCGGVGKTRLAKEVAITAAQTGNSRVSLVQLSEHRTNVKARQHLMDVVDGLYDRGGHLELTIIDNCEHVLDSVYDFANQAEFRDIPGQFLFTSREAISFPKIRNFKVPGLSVPDENEDIDSYLQFESVALLSDRLSLIRNYGLELGEMEMAGRLVRLLSGLPLAIEQVATNARFTTLEEAYSQLRNRLHTLEFIDDHDEARHQTMLRTMEWSFDLLSQPEKRAMGVAASLEGLFRPAHIAALSYDFGKQNYVKELERKSLISRILEDSLSPFEVIPCIRDCARVTLTEELLPVPVLIEFCLGVVEDAYRETNGKPSLWSIEDMRILARTIEACFEYLLETNDPRTPAMLSKAYRYYTSAGNPLSLLPLFEQVLSSIPDTHEEFLGLLNGKGQLEWQAGRIDEAKCTMRELVNFANSASNMVQSATALGNIAVLELNYGDIALAEAPLREAQTIFAEAGEISRYWATTANIIYLSVVSNRSGEFLELANETLSSKFIEVPMHIRSVLQINFADVFEQAGLTEKRIECLKMVIDSSLQDEDNHSFLPAILRLIPWVFERSPHDAAILFGMIQDYLGGDENLGRKQFREKHAVVFEVLDQEAYRESILFGNFIQKGQRAVEAFRLCFPS